MIKVTLIGDSIRQIGYGKKVPELLGEAYTVWQPADNCRFAQYTLRGMWDWASQMEGSDVVHWNNGLWDVCELYGDGPFTPLDAYVSTMARIGRILQARHPRVIFATTTPVHPDHPHNRNSVIEAYNAAVVPVLREMGIEINDLYTPVAADIDRYICPDRIHLSEEGIQLCSDMVAARIRAAVCGG